MSRGMLVERQRGRVTFTIANGQTVSDAQNIGGMVIAGIVWPAAWTAADLRFQASIDGINFFPVHGDDGNRVQIASAALSASEARFYTNKAILEQLAPCTWLKLDSSVAQGAERVITLALKG